MMISLENEKIQINVNEKGAELTRLFFKKNATDYLWNGDPAFWGKHSPVLFPVVGTLKGNTYIYNDSQYQLGRHGFARDMVFEVETKKDDNAVLLLKSNEQTLKNYPFHFELRLRYSLEAENLFLSYEVINTGAGTMYFSIGGHPAFKLPLEEGINYGDYFLEFNHKETAGRWPISNDGLIEEQPLPLLETTSLLPLSKSLFSKDALVLKGLKSDRVTLRSAKGSHGLHFKFGGFPFLGLWAAPNADFICIEPWCGIADSVLSDQQLTRKEGIIKLDSHQSWKRNWSVSLF